MIETFVLWEETIHGAAAWSHVLKRGTALRITDLQGGANVGAVFYNSSVPSKGTTCPIHHCSRDGEERPIGPTWA